MREFSHGETYCEHCKEHVVLCSHGMGIDYAELLKDEEEKNKEILILLKQLEWVSLGVCSDEYSSHCHICAGNMPNDRYGYPDEPTGHEKGCKLNAALC